MVRSDILGRVKGRDDEHTGHNNQIPAAVSDIAIQYKHPLLPPSPESVTTLRVAGEEIIFLHILWSRL